MFSYLPEYNQDNIIHLICNQYVACPTNHIQNKPHHQTLYNTSVLALGISFLSPLPMFCNCTPFFHLLIFFTCYIFVIMNKVYTIFNCFFLHSNSTLLSNCFYIIIYVSISFFYKIHFISPNF